MLVNVCTYYSIVNVNKTNYPFLSSYEQEQTWTLTRTMSNNPKRYQSSIENIHLTMANSSLKTKSTDIKVEKNRSIALLPTKQDSTSSETSSTVQQEQITIPIKTIPNNRLNSKIKKSRPLTKPMRVIHSDGEFIVRI